MDEDKVTETIGYASLFIMVIILIVLGINHFAGDPLGVHK